MSKTEKCENNWECNSVVEQLPSMYRPRGHSQNYKRKRKEGGKEGKE
jgi:hypothetical protein